MANSGAALHSSGNLAIPSYGKLPLASFPSECYANGGAALTEELPLATVALANAFHVGDSRNAFHLAKRNDRLFLHGE